MSLNLSDDLRQAVRSEGTPLKLVDPATGETYVLVPESTFARAQSLLSDQDDLSSVQVSNADLLGLAERHRPPKEWLEGEEEALF
jgi:hypothetical protein